MGNKKRWRVFKGNCAKLSRTRMKENSVDCIVSDIPYGHAEVKDLGGLLTCWITGEGTPTDYLKSARGFMGKEWDALPPSPADWKEHIRVLKPGGHAVIMCGNKKPDLVGITLRLAGFEIREIILWLYASGFPKSHNISMAIDKAAGAKRKIIGPLPNPSSTASRITMGRPATSGSGFRENPMLTASATEEAKQYEGYGTALKPANEIIFICRKPMTEKTVAANVLKYGTGALNIDGCRIATDDGEKLGGGSCKWTRHNEGWKRPWMDDQEAQERAASRSKSQVAKSENLGRWPANLLLTHYQDCTEERCVDGCPILELSQQSGTSKSGAMKREVDGYEGKSTTPFLRGKSGPSNQHGDAGTAARFFYCTKPSKKERTAGLPEGMALHPTMKPIELMRYLIRLVLPPKKNPIVYDPYCGSGTTGCAAVLEGAKFIGCDLDPEDAGYAKMARARISYWEKKRGK